MVLSNDIETISMGCVWAQKEICQIFHQSWSKLGDVSEVLTTCHANKESFQVNMDDDQLLAFYREAVRLLATGVASSSISKIAACISALDPKQQGRTRACYTGWIGGVACLAILRFYRDTHNKPTTDKQMVSVKATMMPNLTVSPWDMSTVDNFQMTTPMIMFGRFNNEPGEKRALRSSLCWLRDYIDGHAVLGEDICWSDDDPGSEFYKQRYDRSVLSYPFFEFWDEAWESLTTRNLVGVMCVIPEEFRGVATVGSGFVCASIPSFDPHETLDTAEFLGAILCSMLLGWAYDYDMEHGIYGGNVLGLWCPTTRDRITKLVFDRHRPWISKESHWRVHMTINLYFLGGVRHFSTIRRTIGYSLFNSTTTATAQEISEIDHAQFVALLCALGLSETDVKSVDVGPITIPRPCESCYSLALMTELVAVTTGIPRVCSSLGERGLLAAACMDLEGLRLLPEMHLYIGIGCECVVQVIGACAVDGFTHCGLETPSKLMNMNAEMRRCWSPSLEQGIRDKAAELGYPVNEHVGRKFEVILTEIDVPCCN